MKTFFEYVTTPGRPAATSPASRTAPAAASSSSSASPRAAMSVAASVASSGSPCSARCTARRIAVSTTRQAYGRGRAGRPLCEGDRYLSEPVCGQCRYALLGSQRLPQRRGRRVLADATLGKLPVLGEERPQGLGGDRVGAARTGQLGVHVQGQQEHPVH